MCFGGSSKSNDPPPQQFGTVPPNSADWDGTANTKYLGPDGKPKVTQAGQPVSLGGGSTGEPDYPFGNVYGGATE